MNPNIFSLKLFDLLFRAFFFVSFLVIFTSCSDDSKGTIPVPVEDALKNIEKRYTGYLMADAQLSITNLWDRLRIDLNVKNIFDTDFHIPYGSNTSWASRGMMGRGRWFMLTAKYSF